VKFGKHKLSGSLTSTSTPDYHLDGMGGCLDTAAVLLYARGALASFQLFVERSRHSAWKARPQNRRLAWAAANHLPASLFELHDA
jgi:hypothetical protein